MFCTFWLRNVPRATTACNFASLIWPAGSAPAALASLLFDSPELQIIGKTQCPTFSRTCIFFLLTLSLLWSSLCCSSLLFFDSYHLCFSSVHIVGSLTSKLPSVIVYIYLCLCSFRKSLRIISHTKIPPQLNLKNWSPTKIPQPCDFQPRYGAKLSLFSWPADAGQGWIMDDMSWDPISSRFRIVFVWGKFHGFWNAPEVIGPPKLKLDRIGSRSFENADCRSQQFDLRQRKNWVSARKLLVLSHRGLALEPSKKQMR